MSAKTLHATRAVTGPVTSESAVSDHRWLSKRSLLQSDYLVLRPALTQGAKGGRCALVGAPHILLIIHGAPHAV